MRTVDPSVVRAMRVVATPSRSRTEVGTACDGQGHVAAVELDLRRGVSVGVAEVADWASADPSRPCVIQLMLTSWTPASRAPARPPPVHRRVRVVLRFEPSCAAEVVASHGGGAAGSRAALVAATERLAAWLRGTGRRARALDAGALDELIAEGRAHSRLLSTYILAPSAVGDLDRVVALAHGFGAELSVLAVTVDVSRADRRRSVGVIGVHPAATGSVDAGLFADPAIRRTGRKGAAAWALSAGGGPLRLAPALALARR